MRSFIENHAMAIILVAVLVLEVAFMFVGAIFIKIPETEWVVCRPVPENATVITVGTVTKIEGGKVNYCYYTGNDIENPNSGKFSVSDEEFARLQIGDKALKVQYEDSYWHNFFLILGFIFGMDAVVAIMGYFGILAYAAFSE